MSGDMKTKPESLDASVDARRRAALARLGLATTVIYAAPVILRLKPAVAATSHCNGGNHNCNTNGNGH